MVTFWVSVITGSHDKIVFKLYIICTKLNSKSLLKFKWLEKIISIIDECQRDWRQLVERKHNVNYFYQGILENGRH